MLDDVGFLARRRIVSARAFAERHVPAPGRDLVGERVHRLRVTWLRAAQGIAPTDPTVRDPSEAERRFLAVRDALGPPRAPERWSVGKRLAAAGVVVGLGLGVWFAVRGARTLAPPQGGATTLAAADEEAFVQAVTDYVIALDRWARARADGAIGRTVADAWDTVAAKRGAILAPAVAAFLGGEAVEAMTDVLDQLERTASGRRWQADEQTLAEDVRALNRALAAARRDYFLDSYAALYDDGRPETALFVFRVAARRDWRVVSDAGDADGEVVPALHLRRLDHLNIVQLLLGYTSKRMDVAALLLDQLEGEIVTRVGPALPDGELMPLQHADVDADADWLPLVKAAAAERVRAAVMAEFTADREGMRALGVALARRAALVASWKPALDERGVRLTSFDRYDLDADDFATVERLLGPAARRDAERAQEALAAEPVRRRFEALLARHARPVEEHEVQHRLDYRLGDAFAAPEALLALLGIAVGSPAASAEDVVRAAYELSAYTSEIARDPTWAAVDLALLTEHLLDGSGGAEGYSAVLVLDGLREVLGLPGLRLADTPPVSAGAAARAYLALAKVPGENLSRAASELWTRWFRRPLPALTPVTPTLSEEPRP